MTKVTLNCDSITQEFSATDLGRILKVITLGLTYMYMHPQDFSSLEEDCVRELRARLIDFYDDITPDDLPF